MYNEKDKSFFYDFLFFSFLFSIFCYLSVDPMKSCLFLVLSLLSMSPFFSFGLEVWYSYFICMVFLSGIFVILVYFTSMSKYNFFSFNYFFFILFGFFLLPCFSLLSNFSLYTLYFYDYMFVFFWLIFSLFFFMNFTSYFLNFSGALRKA